jgi:hypothetical protein
VRVSEEDFRGTTLYRFEDVAAEEPEEPAQPDGEDYAGEGYAGEDEEPEPHGADGPFAEPEEVCVARVGSVFLLTTSLASAQDVVLAHAGAEGAVLADQASYRLIRERTRSPRAFSVYVDAARVLAAVRGFIPTEEEREVAEDVIAALGVRDLRCIGGGYDVRADGLWQRFFLHDTGPRRGLVWSLLGRTGPSAPPAFMPADRGQFVLARVDFTELWASVEELIRIAMESEGGALEDAIEPVEAMLGMSLSDVFAALGDDVVWAAATPFASQEPAGMMVGFAGVDLALRLKGMETLHELRTRLAALAAEQGPDGWPFEEREYLGRILHVMKPGMTPPELVPSFAITDNLLLFSLAPDRLQDIVRQLGSDSGGIGATEGYKRVAPLVPAQVGLLTYANGEQMDRSFDQVEQALEMASGMAGPDEEAGVELLLELLPRLRALLGSFDASVGWSEVADAGWGLSGVWLFEETD